MTKNRTKSESRSGKILWIGWGDLARKCKEALSAIRKRGYEILALDVVKKPTALKSIEPDELFCRSSVNDHRALVSIAKQHGFDAVYVANLGHQHISSALEFQNFTPHIVVAKPLDTCLDFLLNITKDYSNYRHLLDALSIHDHYLNKPGVVFLRDRMPELHAEHEFLESIELFLVERQPIEEKEPSRLKVLECGMLFDLAVHMISILQMIVPRKIKWHDGKGVYERSNRQISVTACITAKDAGSLLTKSTVVRGREAETFGIIELKITEQIRHADSGVEVDHEIPVLVVVGKGVPAEQGVTRDLKTLVVHFRDGAEVALDLDTYGFRGIEDKVLKDTGYKTLDFKQRGINLPLVSAAQTDFDLLRGAENPFQRYEPALESVRILSEALFSAHPRPTGYRASYTACSQLVNTLLRGDTRFSAWNLPTNFGNMLIGTLPDDLIH